MNSGKGTIMIHLSPATSVVFVCTGNICRSPTAEAVFRQKIKLLMPDHTGMIDSAGIQGYHIGEPPDPRSITTAHVQGTEMSGLRARKIGRDDFTKFDHIIAMDKGHLTALRQMQKPGDTAVLSLFLNYHDLRRGEDVPDPYYGSARDFEHTYRVIEAGVDAILKAFSLRA
jgi:protein-tyrosine phosphatase